MYVSLWIYFVGIPNYLLLQFSGFVCFCIAFLKQHTMQLFHTNSYTKLVQRKVSISSNKCVRTRERAPKIIVERLCFIAMFMLTATVIRTVITVQPAKRTVNKLCVWPMTDIEIMYCTIIYSTKPFATCESYGSKDELLRFIAHCEMNINND